MNCRRFERELPEWMAGRLSSKRAQGMQTHHAACAVCQAAVRRERDLRRQWQSLPLPDVPPDLGPRLSAQMTASAQYSARLSRRVHAVGAAMAVACVVVAVWVRSPRPLSATVNPLSVPAITVNADTSLMQMVGEIRQLPESDSDTFDTQTEQRQQAQRLLLVGKEAN